MLVFEERGKPEFPEKNLSEQSREPTNSAHIWRWVRESNPTLVEGERSHHYTNPAPHIVLLWLHHELIVAAVKEVLQCTFHLPIYGLETLSFTLQLEAKCYL